MNQEKEENTFKEVSKDTKVTNLGTFGNRKKTPAPMNLATPHPSQTINSSGIANNTNQNEPVLNSK